MALITCPKCGKQFSEHAKACPQCGISKDEALLLIQKREEKNRWANEHKTINTEEPHVRADERTDGQASNKKKVVIAIIILFVIIGVVAIGKIVTVDNGGSAEIEATQVEETTTDNSTEKIQDILSTLSANCSKSGNTAILSDLFTETIDPYVKEGTTKKAKDIPESMRKFLSRYDYYEMSSPTELNVQPRGNGYIATYNVIVEWNSKRTGHKHACLQKTVYLNSEYKITGFTDNELWRENVSENSGRNGSTVEVYDIVVGTYAGSTEPVMQELRSKGYSGAFVVHFTDDKGKSMKRVIAERANSKDEAHRIKESLSRQNVKAWIWKHDVGI